MSKQQFAIGLYFAVLCAAMAFTSEARGIAAAVFSIVTCASASPCTGGTNTSSGAGVQGISSLGKGVLAQTKFNSTTSANAEFGLLGQDLSTTGIYDEGVRGTSVRGLGVHGISTSRSGVRGDATSAQGVYGSSSTNAGVQGVSTSTTGSGNGVTGTALGHGSGVAGSSTSGIGVNGTSTDAFGVEALSTNGTGLFASSSKGFAISGHTVSGSSAIDASGPIGVNATGTTIGVNATSNGVAVYGSANSSGVGLVGVAVSGDGMQVTTAGSTGHAGAYIQNTGSNGMGAEVQGFDGVVARSPSGGFPFIATDMSGHNLFFVDSTGAVWAHNGFHLFAPVNGGGSATAYSSRTTTPTIEDTGTARLVNGVATVTLDSTFARTIDPHTLYRVMLTPDGDTRGLYVARKTPAGFTVRETMGGRGTLDFDYHIYATALGSAGERMTAVPNAPVVARHFTRPRP